MRKPRLNPVFMAMGVWMPALMAGALEECCLQELFGFGDTAVDCSGKLDLDSVHTRTVPSISSKLGHF